MNVKGRKRLAVWLGICVLIGMLGGCSEPEKGGTVGSSGWQEITEEVVAEENIPQIDEVPETYAGPIYYTMWLDVELMVESVKSCNRVGELLYIRGVTAPDEDGKQREIIMSCRLDGTEQKLILELPEKGEWVELKEGESHTYTTYAGMQAYKDGSRIILWQDNRNTYGQLTETVYWMEKIDAAGTVLWSSELPAMTQPEDWVCVGEEIVFLCTTIVCKTGGHVYDNMEFLVYGGDGSLKSQYNTGRKDISGLREWSGKLYAYDGYREMGALLREIDPVTGAFGEAFGEEIIWTGDWIGAGAGYDLLTSTGAGINGYQLGDSTGKTVLFYVSSGMNPGEQRIMIPVNGQDFLMIVKNMDEYEGAQSQMALLTKPTAEEVERRPLITVGVIGGTCADLPIRFNEQGEPYRMETVTYLEIPEWGYEYLKKEDYVKAAEKLKADIEAGTAPDVLVLSQYVVQLLYEEICAGAFEDLGLWLDRDGELSRDMLFESALKAGEKDGKLYTLIPTFRVTTMAGKSSIFGESDGCTAAELLEISLRYPNSEICPDIRGQYAIGNLVKNSGFSLINEAEGSVHFDSEEFRAMLEIAKRMNELGDVRGDRESWYKGDSVLLEEIQLGNFSSLQMCDKRYGEIVSCVGYPGVQGNGSVLYAGTCVLMSASSNNKEGAWAFIRSFLEEDYQLNNSYGHLFPVRLSVLETLIERQTAWYEDKDIYGNVTMKQIASETDVERITKILEDAQSLLYQDIELRERLIELVREKSKAYFSGEMTVDEIARVIQKKAEDMI